MKLKIKLKKNYKQYKKFYNKNIYILIFKPVVFPPNNSCNGFFL